MVSNNNLITVGGTARNVGKTEFVCRLIERVSCTHDVYGLKVSAIFPDEMRFHGVHDGDAAKVALFEETNRESRKDTSRMLRAGAKRVFFLSCDDNDVAALYADFIRNIPAGGVVVCESNNLSEHVMPGLDVMVRDRSGSLKKRAAAKIPLVDIVVVSTGRGGFPELERIRYSVDKGWHLK